MVLRMAICSRSVAASLRRFAGPRLSGSVTGPPVPIRLRVWWIHPEWPRSRRDRPGHPVTGCRPAAVPVIFSTFFAPLRIPKPEMISTTPRMISQMPTTRANVTIESNG